MVVCEGDGVNGGVGPSNSCWISVDDDGEAGIGAEDEDSVEPCVASDRV